MAQIIILNGPSGSGKTSIQKAFQQAMLPSLWIKLGIDSLFDAPMPDITPENMHMWQVPNATRYVTTTEDAAKNTIITLYTGSEGEKVAYGMNSAIAAYAQQGLNIIVDYIAYKPEWLADLKEKLSSFSVLYVSVSLPLSVLEEREKARGTSPVGHARSHYDTVFGSEKYDLYLDTGTDSVEQCVMKLKKIVI